MMAAKRDYYETLGIDKKSDKAAIKRAYRKLAKKYHPDTNAGDAHAEEMFKDVTEAYNVLSDEKKRKLYDEFGFAGLQEGFSEEAARQASHGGFGGFGGFGGNGAFSGSYSSNGEPFTHQEFHFENGSADMDDIFSMFGSDEIYDRIWNFMCDMLSACFCIVESDIRLDWMYYLWLFCWDYVARHNQYFIRKISGRRNGYVCFACYGGGPGWKHRSGTCWTCYTKCRRQYSCRYGSWTFVPGYFINHAFYFCKAKK
mgnify:CR=1 FL=1